MAWSTFSFADFAAGLTFYSTAFAPIFFDNDFPNAVITTAAAGICLWPYQYGTYNNAENVLTFNVKEKFGPNIDPYKYGYFLGANTSSIWDHGTSLAIKTLLRFLTKVFDYYCSLSYLIIFVTFVSYNPSFQGICWMLVPHNCHFTCCIILPYGLVSIPPQTSSTFDFPA